jgi:TetR/AcrR family transcriptional regulator, cholesterol catabolism regulator
MAKIKAGKNASKKEVIIKKAASLFRTKGFNAASMRELAEAVGVEAPSLYNHIGSKSELLQTICFKVANKFTTQLDEAENKAAAITTKIELIIRFHITMMLDEFDEVFVANHEWKHLQEPFLSNFLNQRRSYEKRLVAIIEKGIQKKELKNINPYVAVLTLLSAVRGLEFWQRHKKNISTTVLENDMVTHLLHGMIILRQAQQHKK